jgi:hypothetical protein
MKNILVSFVLTAVLIFFSTDVCMGGLENPSKADIVISDAPSAKERDVPSEAKLVGFAQEIIEKAFSEDLKKSMRVKGDVTSDGRDGTLSRFALMCLFLYRNTYTAVTHRIVFNVCGDGYTIVSVDDKAWETPGNKSK